MTDLRDRNADLLAQIAQLKAENERLAKAQASRLSVKLGEKGTINVYGCGRFPVSLYKSQWIKILHQDTIAAIKALFPMAPDKE